MEMRGKEQGAITVYMSIILLAVVVLVGGLVDGTRIRTARVQVKRSVDMALKSALAGYDHTLKEEYGIFALHQNNPEYLQDVLRSYINRNLMTELGVDPQKLGRETYGQLKVFSLGKDQYKNVRFLNLYDYRVEEVEVTPIFNLTENEVTRDQIIEYMKYRAPKELSEGFIDIILSVKQFGAQSNTMQTKIKTDKKLQDLRKLQEGLASEVEIINQFDKQNTKVKMEQLIAYAKDIILKERQIKSQNQKIEDKEKDIRDKKQEVQGESDENEKKKLKKDLDDLQDDLKDLENKLNQLKREHNHLKKELKKLNDSLNNTIKQYNKAIDQAMKIIDDFPKKSNEALEAIKKTEDTLKGQEGRFKDKMSFELQKYKKLIEPKSLDKYKTVLEDNQTYLDNILSCINKIPNVTVGDRTTENDIINYIKKAVNYKDVKNNAIEKYKKVNYALKLVKKDDSQKGNDPRKVVLEEVKKEIEEQDKSQVSTEEEDFLKKLPSYQKEDGTYPNKVSSEDFTEQDNEYLCEHNDTIQDGTGLDLDDGYLMDNPLGSQNADFQDEGFSVKAFDIVSKMMENMSSAFENSRDEVYVNEYIVGTFKNAVTEKIPDERDLRYVLMSDKDTYFNNSEVEYILMGSANESWNTNGVKKQILLIRFALNTMHVYLDGIKNIQALKIATAVAGWTGFGIPIVHTLVMCGWAMGESLLDIHALMNGKRVPFYKTSNDWRLSINGITKELQKAITKRAATAVTDVTTDLTQRAIEKSNDIISGIVDNAIDAAFAPVDELLKEGAGQVDKFKEEISKISIPQPRTDNELEKLKTELLKMAIEKVKNKVNKKLSDGVSFTENLVYDIKEEVRDEIHDVIEQGTDSLNNIAAEKITQLVNEAIYQIEKKMDEGADKLADYIGEGAGESAKESFKSSLITLSYKDYLRLFLLATPPEKKISRIEDLIQLNMSKHNPEFKLSDYNTYLRVEVTVSIKYMFLTQPFMPADVKTAEGDRHIIKVLMYSGY